MRNINQERAKAVAEFMESWNCEYLAQAIRRFVHEAIQMSFVVQEKDFALDKDWFADGYYLLTELTEALDPQMKKE